MFARSKPLLFTANSLVLKKSVLGAGRFLIFIRLRIIFISVKSLSTLNFVLILTFGKGLGLEKIPHS